MKKSRTLWHIFLLLLYPAAEEVAAASEDAMEVAFGAAFSVTCLSEKNGTVPVWSFNGGGELPKEVQSTLKNECDVERVIVQEWNIIPPTQIGSFIECIYNTKNSSGSYSSGKRS